MKLIYTWIEKYRNLEKIALSWDSEFEVEFFANKSVINIKRTKNYINIFPKHINNITAIVGKNGVGKSNILNLLSHDIKKLYIKKNITEKEGFFNIYYLKNDLYVIEGVGLHIIDNILEQNKNFSEDFCITVRNLNGKFLFESYGYEEHFEKKPEFAYLRYVNRIDKRKFDEYNNSNYKPYKYLADRKNSKYFSKYRLIDAINKSEGNFKKIFFKEKPIYLSITKNFLHEDDEIEFKIEHGINILDLSKRNYKRDFILDILEGVVRNLFEIIKNDSNYEYKKLISQIEEIQVNNEYIYYLEIYSLLLEKWMKMKKIEEIDKNIFLEGIKKLIELLDKIPSALFEDEKEIQLSFIKDNIYIVEVTKLIDEYNQKDYNYLNFITLNYMSFSTGEQELIDLFSTLYDELSSEDVAKHEHILLVLDEPNNSMHPEWSRRLINLLIEFLKDVHFFIESSKQLYNPNLCKYTIVFATHSPFMISDLSKNHVIALEISDENESTIKIKNDMRKTFASNIHTLFSDSFFMEITIGEFAKNKIDLIIKRLNEVNLNKEKELSEFEKEEFNYIIDCIGEPLISIKLNEMYLKAIENDKELRKNLLEENIKKLQNELQRLDENDKNL